MPTLNKKVKFTGRGIHSGLPVNMIVLPSKDVGIFFRRVDIAGSGLIPARFDNVGETKMRNTTIGDVCGAHVQTIEHLMAALFLAGVDSAIIEIDGPETPILDGSAAQFLDAFLSVGVTDGDMKKIIVRRPVIVRAKEVFRQLPFWTRVKLALFNLFTGRRADGFVKLEPLSDDTDALDIIATLVYKEKIIGTQTYSYQFDGTKKSVNLFIKDIARARTFGKFSEWEYLKARGMGRGADETNVIALNDAGDGTLNSLNWADEFVRHKIIDAVGDMFTSGGMVVGKLTSYKGSHAMNNLVLKKLFSDAANCDIISGKEKKVKK